MNISTRIKLRIVSSVKMSDNVLDLNNYYTYVWCCCDSEGTLIVFIPIRKEQDIYTQSEAQMELQSRLKTE